MQIAVLIVAVVDLHEFDFRQAGDRLAKMVSQNLPDFLSTHFDSYVHDFLLLGFVSKMDTFQKNLDLQNFSEEWTNMNVHPYGGRLLSVVELPHDITAHFREMFCSILLWSRSELFSLGIPHSRQVR